MINRDGINIPAARLAEWRAEKEKLEQAIAAAHQKLAVVEKKLEAAAILSETAPAARSVPLPARAAIDEGGGVPNMTVEIEKIANESPSPITKKEVKKRLTALGFPKDRLSSYFYTPIMRLKQKRRISVLPDGKIWKAPA